MFIILYVVLGIVALGILVLFVKFFGLWFRALLSGAPVGPARLIGMWLRKVDPNTIVNARIMLAKAGIPLDTDQMGFQVPMAEISHWFPTPDNDRITCALAGANSGRTAAKRGTYA